MEEKKLLKNIASINEASKRMTDWCDKFFKMCLESSRDLQIGKYYIDIMNDILPDKDFEFGEYCPQCNNIVYFSVPTFKYNLNAVGTPGKIVARYKGYIDEDGSKVINIVKEIADDHICNKCGKSIPNKYRYYNNLKQVGLNRTDGNVIRGTNNVIQSLDGGVYSSYISNSKLDKDEQNLKSYLPFLSKKTQNDKLDFINSEKNKIELYVSKNAKIEKIDDAVIKAISEDNKELTKFIDSSVEVLANISVTEKRIEDLIVKKYDLSSNIEEEQSHVMPQYEARIRRKEAELCSALNEDLATNGITISNLNTDIRTLETEISKVKNSLYSFAPSELKKPEYPSIPVKPIEPVAEKYNIFNKGRILKEYEEKKAVYNSNLLVYEKEMEKYNREVADLDKQYQIDNEKYKQNQIDDLKNKNEERIKVLEETLTEKKNRKEHVLADRESLNNLLAEKKKILETVKKEALVEFSRTPSVVICENIDKEMDMAKTLMSFLCNIKESLIQSGIVYEKYFALVPLASFSDYFKSGRTDKLTGTDGCYNMFENEKRQNLIVDKLDTVINSLESIKENQYEMYKQMKKANSYLHELSCKFDDFENMVEQQYKDLGGSLEKLNKTQEAIEYNTALTAYYTEKQNSLLFSLGYLMLYK